MFLTKQSFTKDDIPLFHKREVSEMSYQFTTAITQEQHNEFIKKSAYCNLLQSAQWAKVKDNWGSMLAGVKDEHGNLVASSLILIKQLPMHFTMFYIPRGPILDYENANLLRFYFQELKKVAKKHHCLFMKFDPELHIRDFEVGEKDVPMYDSIEQIMANIQHAGGIHQGFTTFIEETIQPRFHMGVKQCAQMDDHVPRATFRSKNVAVRKHVHVELVGKEGLHEFAEVMKLTEKRKNVALRDEQYFEKLMDIYGEQAYLFLARVNPHVRANELREQLSQIDEELQSEETGNKKRKKLVEEQKQAVQELDSMKDLLEAYPGETTIAGGLMIGFGDTVEMLYAGMNEDFKTFRPQYLTYMTQFTYAFEQGYAYVTMGGVEGTLEDGLSAYKRSFNPLINEMIGEFDYPVNMLFYKASKLAYQVRKKKHQG